MRFRIGIIGICIVFSLILFTGLGHAAEKPYNEENEKLNLVASSSSSMVLENQYLQMTIYSDGNFNGETAAGDDILYPSSTSDFTIKIGNNEYSVDHGSLYDYLTRSTYINPSNSNEAITEWDVENFHVEQHIKLEQDHVTFNVIVENNNNVDKEVSLRYLWDTQLCHNDGSPLKTKGVLYTEEMYFEPVDFSSWSAYSTEDEDTAELVTYSWWQDCPDKLIFGAWRTINDYPYDCYWDPARSITSDSAVVMYWENMNIPAHGSEQITLFYGTSVQTGLSLSMSLDNDAYYQGSTINVQVDAYDASNNIPYPIKNIASVEIDGEEVEIENIEKSGQSYLIKVKSPTDIGIHNLKVQVNTDQGSASGQQSFSVTEGYTGTVTVSLQGNVDEATGVTKYEAPVFRKGIDNPQFVLKMDQDVPDDYSCEFEIRYKKVKIKPLRDENNIKIGYYLLEDSEDIARTNFNSKTSTKSFVSFWKWTGLNGDLLSEGLIPIGIYSVKPHLFDSNGNELNLVNNPMGEFYVIFGFDLQSENSNFIVDNFMDKIEDRTSLSLILQPFGLMSHAFNLFETKQLHQYDSKIWMEALNHTSGCRSPSDIPEEIYYLSHNIGAEYNGHAREFHHIQDDERVSPFNWNRNYNHSSSFYTLDGRAYYEENDGTKHWIDKFGNDVGWQWNALKVCWYHDDLTF